MSRVSNIGQHERMVSLIMQTQERANAAELQIASGRKAQNYAGIARDAVRLVEMETTHVRVNQYISNNKLVDDRLQLMESSVGQIFSVMTRFKTLLVNALNQGNATELDLPNQASEALDQIATLLNVDLDGRHLFAGSKTNTEPVDLTALPGAYVVPTSDGDSAAYYQGDSVDLSVRADDNLDLAYGVRASETGFEQAIRALDVVVKGAPTDRTMLNHALDVVNTALDNIADVRTRIGNTRTSLTEIEKTHQDFVLFAEETIGDLENTDIPIAITRLNEAQVSLQASYMTLSRLSQITLMQFIR